jgi:hypothetical protein
VTLGEGDPVKAVEDVLVTFSAERIVLFTRPVSERRYDSASTPTHCSNGLACRSCEPNEKPEPLSAQARWGMRTVSYP